MATELSEETEALSAKQAATLLGTDARTLRKFLRREHGLVGQGQRWQIDPEGMPKLRKKFEAWQNGNAKAKPNPIESPEPDDEERDEYEEMELEELEPTDEELEELELEDN